MLTSYQEVDKKNKRVNNDYKDRNKNNNKTIRGNKRKNNNIANRVKKKGFVLYFEIFSKDFIIASIESKGTNKSNKGNKKSSIKKVEKQLKED